MHQRSQRLDPRVVDALVVVGVATPGLVGLVGVVVAGLASSARITPLAVLLVFGQAVVLWWRRRRPLLVLAATVAAVLVAQAVGDGNASSFLGVHAAAYAVGAHASRRVALVGLGGLVAAALVDVAVVTRVAAAGADAAVLAFPGGLLVLLAWGGGRYVRMRRAYVDTLVAYAHQVERERDEQARQAVREERRRIARDLHDQIAHHLGVVSLQTGAARRWLERDPARSADALAAAERASRAALTTMPAILQALRTDDEPDRPTPQPSLADVPALVDEVSGSGLSVELVTDGEVRPLDPAVELTAYRVVQEALTNVVKHAGRARATVVLRYGPDKLDIEVADDGRGLAADHAPGDGGHGLLGMRERVEGIGGVLAHGPRSGGGFHVEAILPAASRGDT